MEIEEREIELTGRDGVMREFSRDAIIQRINGFIKGYPGHSPNLTGIDTELLVNKIINNLPNKLTTSEIDVISARVAHGMITQNPDYDLLAARIFMDNIHKMTPSRFSHAMNKVQANHNPLNGKRAPFLSERASNFIIENAFALDSMIDNNADYDYPYSGMFIMYEKYLTYIYDDEGNRHLVDRPQYIWMRVAIMASRYDITRVERFYRAISEKKLSVATPVANNACRRNEYMSSCFLAQIEDNIEDIFGKLAVEANLSKFGGGIGNSFDKIRSRTSYIEGTGGTSNGVIPFISIYESMLRCVDQGGNKRSGSGAVYLSAFHPDFPEFIQMQTVGKDVSLTASLDVEKHMDIFPAQWIPDLFFERVRADGMWSFFDPSECPLLYETFDNKRTGSKTFTRLYESYEAQRKYRKQMKATTLFQAMIRIMMETTRLYFCSKDNANSMSNQVDLPESQIIKLTNLCTEIYQLTSPTDISNCNLASIVLPQFVKGDGSIDTEELMRVSGIAVELLNSVIDQNKYVSPMTRDNNMRMRPIAIGVQGLANMLLKTKGYRAFTESADRVSLVAEAIYLGAILSSAEEAKHYGPYPAFTQTDCLYRRGIFSPQMYEDGPGFIQLPAELWNKARANVMQYGIRNSLTTAWMPTAQTSMIHNCSQGSEPFLFKRFSKKTSVGDVTVVITDFIYEMIERGLWNETAIEEFNREQLISQMPSVPADIKMKYLSAFEMDQYDLIDVYARAQRFIDQGISMNRYGITGRTTGEDLANQIFYAWERGLKTLSYYYRVLQVEERPVAYTLGAKSWVNNTDATAGSDEEDDEEVDGESIKNSNLPYEIKIINGKEVKCFKEADCEYCQA